MTTSKISKEDLPNFSSEIADKPLHEWLKKANQSQDWLNKIYNHIALQQESLSFIADFRDYHKQVYQFFNRREELPEKISRSYLMICWAIICNQNANILNSYLDGFLKEPPLNSFNSFLIDVLYYAAVNEQLMIVNKLLPRIQNIFSHTKYAMAALNTNNYAITKLLVEKLLHDGPDRSISISYLEKAINNQDYDLTHKILNHENRIIQLAGKSNSNVRIPRIEWEKITLTPDFIAKLLAEKDPAKDVMGVLLQHDATILYDTSDENNDEIIQKIKNISTISPIEKDLLMYIVNRSREHEYKTVFSFCSFFFTFGRSKTEKLTAAYAFRTALLHNPNYVFNKQELLALENGELGTIYSRYKESPRQRQCSLPGKSLN